MTIHYTMELEDYLTHNLYIASKSDIIKKRRQRGKIAVSLLYAGVGSFFLFQKNMPTGITFIAIAVLWFLLYPFWEQRYYVKSYKRMIVERNMNSFGMPCSLELGREHLISISGKSESKIDYSEVEGVAEVPTTFLIQLKGGKAFILGKDKLADPEEIRTQLILMTKRTNTPFISDLNWVWK